MKLFRISWAVIGLLALHASCKREPLKDEEESSNPAAVVVDAKDIVAPAGFNFNAEKTLQVRVKVGNAVGGERYAIKIYADVPSTGKLISTGLTNAQAEYSTTVRVPAWQEDVYIEKINPDGSKQFEKAKASQFATALFTNGQQPATYIIRKSSGMDCSSGCDVVYHNPVSNIVVPTGKNVCITGTIGSGITLLVPTGSTARVCASGTFTSVSGNGTLIVLEGAILKINTLTSSLTNWSDSLRIDNPGSLNSELFYNHGKCYVNSVTSSNQVDNYGTLIVNGNFTVPGFNMARNYGYLKVSGNIYSGTLGYFTNNCRIEVAGNFYQEGEFHNYSYVKVGGTFDNNTANTDWPNAAVLYAGSLFSTKNFSMGYGIVYGSSSAIVKVTNNSTFSGGTLANVTYCDANGIESNTGGSTSTAVFSCSGTIAVSTCNPEGFGNAPVADADNDGVADAQDEYPNDAARAFNSYYPNAASTATLAFEDLWPSQGDYEFNDLTLAFNIQQVLNADNKVVEYNVKMKVKSVGGSFDNGFGFQLDELAPADINSVTGQVLVRNLITRNANNTEAGQSKAVIICYDSPEPTLQRAAGSMFNTIKANGQGTSDSVYLSVTFTNPVEEAKLTIDKFNPFIFTNKRRGYEVHMGNYKPTSLANTALFGTSNDRTNPGTNTYYKNANGMPWAILIPEDFTYPTERTSVTAAYNFFDDWALSGGANYTNWYTTAPGNRNTDKLY